MISPEIRALRGILAEDDDERLKGMQGPEQGLVGESRSGSETRPAEEAKPGERGVGEIVEMAELRREIERMISDARQREERSEQRDDESSASFYRGVAAGLVMLRKVVSVTTEKRSDLSNA